jgi:DNA-binding MarR family transcriptional regulator
MLERKQLRYFVVSADVESFSEAAAVLYTTQSNVSKVIASLEEELGYAVFLREGRGVKLTARGRHFYRKAGEILTAFEELEQETVTEKKSVVRIGAASGSWFARKFTEFYLEHEAEELYFNVHTDSLENLLRRIRNMEDELAFVYIFPDQWELFRYELKRYQLGFEQLCQLDGMLYSQPEDERRADDLTDVELSDLSALKSEGGCMNKIRSENVKPITAYTDKTSKTTFVRLIQKEHDPFTAYRDWVFEDGSRLEEAAPDIAVTTNSDYIMHDLLSRSGIANISAEAFSARQTGQTPGLRILRPEGKITFGILTNSNNPLSRTAEDFAAFIKKELELKNHP